jgi:DNA-binding NarL/FixJ family response regulator
VSSVLCARGDDVYVCEAGDVEGAVEAAGSCSPDLIVLDAEIDQLGPESVIPRLRVTAPTAKIVVLARRGDTRTIRRTFAAGAEGYISAQVGLAELDLALAEIERGAKYLDPRLGATLASDVFESGRAPASLSLREQHILELVAAGLTNREIASELGLSVRTIEANRARAQRKLHLRSRSDVVAYVRGLGRSPGKAGPDR